MKCASAAERIVEHLLGLTEATVRRPPRGKRWIAIYTGEEPGKQTWRSTGMTDRAAALALAREWEGGRPQTACSIGAPGTENKKPFRIARNGVCWPAQDVSCSGLERFATTAALACLGI